LWKEKNFVSIKTIPLSQLEANPRRTLIECAESGDAFVIELPEQRFVAIQTIAAAEEDDSFTSDQRPLGVERRLYSRQPSSVDSPSNDKNFAQRFDAYSPGSPDLNF
jgi:hypothetical protein